jgi:hypothetical protein
MLFGIVPEFLKLKVVPLNPRKTAGKSEPEPAAPQEYSNDHLALILAHNTLYPNGRRIEMFARGELPGSWVAWGAEVDK